ncbi:cobalamin-binding protein [soil metagenome]
MSRARWPASGWAWLASLAVALTAALPLAAQAEPVTVTDDTGHTVTLSAPPRRIASLAPHATELLYAIGAGPQIVAALASDHPAAARQLPSAGDYRNIDLERLRSLGVDLVIAWGSGSPAAQLDRLRELGMAVYVSEPKTFEQVATSLERIGRLTGHESSGADAAAAFRSRTQSLADRYGQRRNVRVFYQVWDKPVMTVNGEQVISSAMKLCGASNVFAALPVLAPTVDVEAVIAADPELILTTAAPGGELARLDSWLRYRTIAAVRNRQLATLSPDLLVRMGPRLVDGAQELCEKIDQARQQRDGR